MCLRTITARHDKPQPEVREAWKIVQVRGESVRAPFRETELKVSRWNKAVPREVHTENSTPKTRTGYYMTGFHVFTNEKEARKVAAYLGIGKPSTLRFGYRQDRSDWKLIKVKVRGVMLEGMDGTSCSYEFSKLRIHNWVAQEMFIPVASLRD